MLTTDSSVKEAIKIMFCCFLVKAFFSNFKRTFKALLKTALNKRNALLHAALTVVKDYFMKTLFTRSKQDFILIEILVRDHLVKRTYP